MLLSLSPELGVIQSLQGPSDNTNHLTFLPKVALLSLDPHWIQVEWFYMVSCLQCAPQCAVTFTVRVQSGLSPEKDVGRIYILLGRECIQAASGKKGIPKACDGPCSFFR